MSYIFMSATFSTHAQWLARVARDRQIDRQTDGRTDDTGNAADEDGRIPAAKCRLSSRSCYRLSCVCLSVGKDASSPEGSKWRAHAQKATKQMYDVTRRVRAIDSRQSSAATSSRGSSRRPNSRRQSSAVLGNPRRILGFRRRRRRHTFVLRLVKCKLLSRAARRCSLEAG